MEKQVRRARNIRSQANEGAEEENSKLKRMYADMALENQAIKDLLGKL